MRELNHLLETVRNCSDEAELFRYIREDRPGVILEVAKSLHATPRVLENLTRHPSISVRHEVAKNPNTAKETLERLTKDMDMLVRDYSRRTLLGKPQNTVANTDVGHNG